jgi:predicted transcriptional regulator
MENRTSRLTLLIDPEKKRIFDEICSAQDLTPSQVVRKLIRQYILDNAGNRELPEWLAAGAAKGATSAQADGDDTKNG